MDVQYTYLLMGIVFFVIWLGLFLWRKDTRKEMLMVSSIFAVAGPIADILYTKDWWRPLTLTKTTIGPEALLVGFMIGGIAAVLYEDIFKKKIKARKASKERKIKEDINLFYILLILLVIFFGSFYLLKLNSLVSTIFALLVPTIIILKKRNDLIVESFATGIMLVIVASVVYFFLELLTPGWVQAFWFFENVPNIVFLNLPVDDIMWYFFAGMFIGPLYEYWQEGRFVNE